MLGWRLAAVCLLGSGGGDNNSGDVLMEKAHHWEDYLKQVLENQLVIINILYSQGTGPMIQKAIKETEKLLETQIVLDRHPSTT